MTTSFLKDGKHMERNIRCNILVGTDGAGSTVRKLAGVDLRGEKDLQKLVSVQFLATVFMFLKDTETPLKGGLGNGATTCRRFVHRMVSLDDVKLVKKAMINTTINDVMLGVTQACLSRYLNRKYGESKIDKGASERNNNLPQNIRLRATFLMNIRPSPGIQELADMMKKNSLARWGNHIGYLLFPFTIALPLHFHSLCSSNASHGSSLSYP
ncbi:hypothetical protein Q3G72_024872 [Acer saccharum]|nr:hypothetical protein Q3G72_024872 [Acer saccharum]